MAGAYDRISYLTACPVRQKMYVSCDFKISLLSCCHRVSQYTLHSQLSQPATLWIGLCSVLRPRQHSIACNPLNWIVQCFTSPPTQYSLQPFEVLQYYILSTITSLKIKNSWALGKLGCQEQAIPRLQTEMNVRLKITFKRQILPPPQSTASTLATVNSSRRQKK